MARTDHGCEQAQHAQDEQVECGPAIPTVQSEPRGNAEQQDVHEGVGHRDDLASKRQRGVAGVGHDEEHPCHQAEGDRDDECVDQAHGVPTGVALTDQDHHAGDEQRVNQQVEHVPGGWELRRAAMQQLWQRVVEEVAEDEHRDPCREQVPGEPSPWTVQTDAGQDCHYRGEGREREVGPLAGRGPREQVHDSRQPTERDVESPGPVCPGPLVVVLGVGRHGSAEGGNPPGPAQASGLEQGGCELIRRLEGRLGEAERCVQRKGKGAVTGVSDMRAS